MTTAISAHVQIQMVNKCIQVDKIISVSFVLNGGVRLLNGSYVSSHA